MKPTHAITAIVALALMTCHASAQGEWPQILGPSRNGCSDETGLLDRWPEAGPKLVWRKPGGVGMSGLAVSRNRVVTMVQRDMKQWLVALDAQSGEAIWQTEIAPAYENEMGDGPRATPTIFAEQVFAFTGEGILASANFADGKLKWSQNVVTALRGKVADYGMACSPLVIGGQVIVTVGAPGATVAAFDIKNGKLAWQAGDDPAGYSSPALLSLGGRPHLVVFTGNSALGLVPESGKFLWRYPYKTNYDCNIAIPLAIDDKIFLSSGENHGSVLLGLTPRGNEFDVSTVWESFGPKSVLRNEWQTSLLLNGFLYGMDNVGGAGPITHLTCVEAATGKPKWQVPRFGKGNLIAADGKLFITTMKGELIVARASPEKYDEIGRTEVLGSTRQAPALSNGRLYLRDDQEIVCVDVRKP